MTTVGAAVPAGGGPFVYVADVEVPVLADEDHHHLSRVRRVRDGDPIVLGDGVGCWRPARFAATGPEPTGPVTAVDRPAPRIAVGFALTKGSKPELAVQKLTELGVDQVVPFVAGRSVVRWDADRQRSAGERLRRIAREAAMQSRQAWLVEVADVASFDEVAVRPGACRADRDGAPPSLARPLVLVGPEGGWDDAERASDLPVVGLGPGVLRAETAAIAAGLVLTVLRAGLVAEVSG